MKESIGKTETPSAKMLTVLVKTFNIKPNRVTGKKSILKFFKSGCFCSEINQAPPPHLNPVSAPECRLAYSVNKTFPLKYLLSIL